MSRKGGFKSATPAGLANVHLVDPLRPGDLLSDQEMDRVLLEEALYRGGSDFDLVRILWQRHHRDLGSSRTPEVRSGRPSLLDASDRLFIDPELQRGADETMLRQCRHSYTQALRAEFDGLPDSVRVSFAFDRKKSPFSYYQEIRPAFYQVGYTDPAGAVFSKIQPATILGHEVIGGLHEIFVSRIARLPVLLNSWAPGLGDKVGKQMKSIGGFVPRYIAPRGGEKRAPTLSNHAFGLAIDIDASWNPHIKDRAVIEALREITGYDFGHQFVAKEKGIPELDRAAQIHNQQRDASDRLKRWLQRYLPIFDSIDPARTPARRHKTTPVIPEIEPASSGPLACEPLDSETSVAMVQLQMILGHHPRADVEEWAKHGIQTIPIEFAAAMAQLGFRWGAMYNESKDVMHFELLAAEQIPPDSPKRPFDALLQPAGHFELSTRRR